MFALLQQFFFPNHELSQIDHFENIMTENDKFEKTYDKSYNRRMLRGENVTRNPFITSKFHYVWNNWIFIRLLTPA